MQLHTQPHVLTHCLLEATLDSLMTPRQLLLLNTSDLRLQSRRNVRGTFGISGGGGGGCGDLSWKSGTHEPLDTFKLLPLEMPLDGVLSCVSLPLTFL